LNQALRSEQRESAKPLWVYVKLLQLALFKLPKDGSGTTLYRGIKIKWGPAGHVGPVTLEAKRAALHELATTLIEKSQNGEPEIFWGFSSTSTSLPAVEEFLGAAEPRVIYTIAGGSSARCVKRYSAVPTEDELLLPCGTAFSVETVGSPAPDLLMVSLKQADCMLLPQNGPALDASMLPQDDALLQLADRLSSADKVGRRFEFHQPLPAGLVAVAISRCAAVCISARALGRRA
jgi:hypothetical protein